jgi:hypothetical protein
MRPALFLFAACLALLASSAAEAQFCWGTKEQLIHVKKLPINSPENKPLNLARLLLTQCMGLPYTVTDAGYVLAVEGQETYFALSEQQIASFQSSRALPTPLPDFAMSAQDWLMGHLLWLAVPLAAIVVMGPLALLWPSRSRPAPQPRQQRRPRPAKR